MSVATLHLHPDEVKALTQAVTAALRHEETARLIFPTGAERRAAKRALRKLGWATERTDA